MVDPPLLPERRADLPAEFGQIVRRCLAKEPERRYQTARDVKNDLEDMQRELEWGGRPGSAGHAGQPASGPGIASGSDAALATYREGRIREWSQPRYKLDREFVALTLLVDQGEETASG